LQCGFTTAALHGSQGSLGRTEEEPANRIGMKYEDHFIFDAFPLPDRESGIGATAFSAALCIDDRRAVVCRTVI
jgi:hypothetical protein